MTAFKSLSDEFRPDFRELFNSRPEHVYTLSAGDLCIEVPLLRNPSERHQFFRRDFASGNAWHNGVGTPTLNVGEESVVGILNSFLLEDSVIPYTCKQRRGSGFAYLTTVTAAVEINKLLKVPDIFDSDKIKQLLTSIIEMFTQRLLHLMSH